MDRRRQRPPGLLAELTHPGAVLTLIATAAALWIMGSAIELRNEVAAQDARIACMLAEPDEYENERCLPPVYGSDW